MTDLAALTREEVAVEVRALRQQVDEILASGPADGTPECFARIRQTYPLIERMYELSGELFRRVTDGLSTANSGSVSHT